MSLVRQARSYQASPWETWYSFTATNPWHHAITRYIIMFWIQGRMYWFREVLSQSTGTMSTYRAIVNFHGAIVNFHGNMLQMHTLPRTVRCMTQEQKKSVYDTDPWHHAITVAQLCFEYRGEWREVLPQSLTCLHIELLLTFMETCCTHFTKDS